jgi:phosphoribosylamine--glycine ligase
MRFLGIGEDADLADMYFRLACAGHEVRMHVAKPAARCVYEGMVDHCDDWRTALPWIRAVGTDGIIVFESANCGNLQDELRIDGFQVIGGSAYGDRLESDRNFGQAQLAGHGLHIAKSWQFTDFCAAI